MKIQLEKKHLEIILNILDSIDHEVYVFGSRAKATAKKLSDLDLLIKTPITKIELSHLEETFEESDLPFKVDVLAWETLAESFKKHIEKDLVRIK